MENKKTKYKVKKEANPEQDPRILILKTRFLSIVSVCFSFPGYNIFSATVYMLIKSMGD